MIAPSQTIADFRPCVHSREAINSHHARNRRHQHCNTQCEPAPARDADWALLSVSGPAQPAKRVDTYIANRDHANSSPYHPEQIDGNVLHMIVTDTANQVEDRECPDED